MPDPIALGRSVVVRPGAPAPGPWERCPRVVVAAIDTAVADELHRAWRERRAVVVELSPGLGLDDPEVPPDDAVTGRQPWQWTVDLDLVGERLHHALWANAVDARGGSGSGAMPSRWVEQAVALGAARAPGGDGPDVVLPDGTPAVCDGGPLDADLARRIGLPVLHRIGLEHGVLRPLGPNDPGDVALAPDQLAAVAEPGASARVIAPAGSGKTRVLTERARLLLRGWGLPPGSVAIVAFNVRAAAELRSRLADVPDVRIRTLNALGLRLCGSRTTIDEPEVRRILDDLVSFPRRAETDPAAPWIEALGRVRLGLASPREVEDELPDVSDLDRVARAYRTRLADRGAVDFDEQVTAAVERLLGDPGFRRRSQRFARVLLVDEFQDLTPAHLLLLRLLAGPAGAVFAVGDDDQTIYGYAGATPRWLVDLDQYFPGARSHALEVNYRCPAPVVTAAVNLLTRNALRVPKVIRPVPPPVDQPSGAGSSGAGRGHALAGPVIGEADALSVVSGDGGPATRTASRVEWLLDAGAAPADVVVLARVHASLAPVQVLLRHHGVAVAGAVDRRFLRRGGVRAALAWLAVASAPTGALPGTVLRDAARHPRRGMSASLLDLLAKQRSPGSLVSLADWLADKGSDREAGKVRDLAADVNLVRRAAEGATTAAVLTVVRQRVGDGGLDATAAALDQWSHGAIAAHGDDLDALAELAGLEPDPASFGDWLAGQLDLPAEDEGVMLASIHAVKGREWPHVVLHNLSAGLLPHRLAEDVEEERRVFHVGLTRGRRTVSLVPGMPPSPFLAELSQPGRPAPSTDAAVAPVGSRPSSPVAGGVRARSSPAGERAGRSSGATELLAGEVGATFTWRGHSHRVVAADRAGVRAEVGGGPATTAVAYGTEVTAAGGSAVLAQPGAGAAWERLRAWRAEQAAKMGKPAYIVLDDRTLRMVAAILPTSEAGLLSISGIGPVKLQSYGDDLIALADELWSAGPAGEGQPGSVVADGGSLPR